MSFADLPVKKQKKSAFSCDPCRRRKVKCGGEQPKCLRCLSRHDDCVYNLNPTLSYTQELERRVKELEGLLHNTNNTPSRGDPRTPISTELPVSPASVLKSRAPVSFDGLKLDQRGSITYHGATSLFGLPQAPSSIPMGHAERVAPSDEEARRKERLVESAWQQRVQERFLDTPEPFLFMLRTHWCWVQPLFNFVYRPAFMRDMEVLGPYYSHTLMNAMLSHSVRWCKGNHDIRVQLQQYDNGDLFGRQARTLLFEELGNGQIKIPTVQALLLLSAQECGLGNRTQAWLYSGMAFRLIEDMGICIDVRKYAGNVTLSDEDMEIRNRLFWSCYFWDKIISLYLGRSPTLQHSNVSPPQIMMDDSAETELWAPHGIDYPDGVYYPPTQAHSTSCFMQMCRLSVIFNQILITMYDPLEEATEDDIDACLKTQGAALRSWWDELPHFLKIDPHQLPSHCPPSHIVTLNCLFHVFRILLHRPILCHRPANHIPEANHLVECLSSSTTIIAIFDLYARTFGVDYCLLSLSYSIYIAASIFLLQIQAAISRDDEALERLRFCITALQKVTRSSPVIGSSVALLTDALSKSGYESFSSDKPVGIGASNNTPHNFASQESTNKTISYNGLLPLKQSNVEYDITSDQDYQITSIYSFDPNDFEVSAETLEALSMLQPLDATFGGQ